EIEEYNELLRDRNLLVHGGGTYTAEYVAQSGKMLDPGRDRPFLDSLVVTRGYLDRRFAFIERIAAKLLKASHRALVKYLADSRAQVAKWKKAALDSFLDWGDEKL